jgi:hypothetical protein
MKFIFLLVLFVLSCEAHYSIKPNESLTIIQPSYLSHDVQEIDINLVFSSPFVDELIFQVEVNMESKKEVVDHQLLTLSGDIMTYKRQVLGSRVFLSFRCVNDKVPCILGIEQREVDMWFDINMIQFMAMILISLCVLLLVFIQKNQAIAISRLQSKV